MKKKFVFDIMLNVISTILPISILQLIALPIISRNMTGDKYGLVIVLISLINLIPPALGNPLNSIRLLYDNTYADRNDIRDFSSILLINGAICTILMSFFIYTYEGSISWTNTITIIIISLLRLLYEYYIVAYRLKLNFKRILLNNLLLSLGYIVGTLMYIIFDVWQLIYLIGYGSSMIYILFTTDLWREPLRISKNIKKMFVETYIMVISDFLSRLLSYVDKLLIYPLMGGTTVAIYYAATIIGKIISLTFNPISSVILSYIARSKSVRAAYIKKMFASEIIISIIGYFICIAISKPIISILYPQYVGEAAKYIKITSAASVIAAVNATIWPFTFKFCKIKWQLVINMSMFVGYLILAYSLYIRYALYGFCFSILITRLIGLFMMLIIYIFSSKKGA